MAEKEPTNANSESTGDTVQEIEQKVTPWTATAGSSSGFDYQRLITQFGTTAVDQKLIDKYEKVTGQRAHHLIRRNVFFSHRYATVYNVAVRTLDDPPYRGLSMVFYCITFGQLH